MNKETGRLKKLTSSIKIKKILIKNPVFGSTKETLKHPLEKKKKKVENQITKER